VILTICLASCGGGAAPAPGNLADMKARDGGAMKDGGSPRDAGASQDGGGARDAGSAPDARDAGPAVDAPASVDGTNSTDFTTFLANAAHTNFIDDDTLVPPLRRLWTAPLDGPAGSYPLVVGDLVYVTTSSSDTANARVLAFNRLTGAPAWNAELPTARAAQLAYDGGRLFVVDASGRSSATRLIRAFQATTGALAWQVQAAASSQFESSPPVARGGILYASDSGSAAGPTLYAHDEATGAVLWSTPFTSGTFAVSGDGLFAFDGCGTSAAVRLDGTPGWLPALDAGFCYPPGTPVLVDHTLYEALRRPYTNVRVDTRTGAAIGTFGGDRLSPAFGHGLEVDALGKSLQAVSTATGANAWTFTVEGDLATPALIAGGTVFVASSIGTVYAIDAATGQLAWSENMGSALAGVGMAAAHGVLVVPAGNDLIAYAPAGAAEDAGSHDDGGQPTCHWTLAHDIDPSVPGVAMPTGMVVADFNNDGKRDVALSSWADFDDSVTLFFGAGDGTFQGVSQGPSFSYGTQAVAAADLDGDGVPDVVSASTNGSAGHPNVKVSLNKGDGTLRSPTDLSVGTAPSALALGDLDGNGRADLVVAHANGFSVLLNQGKGTFGTPVGYARGEVGVSVALGDFTGDGKLDVLLGSNDPVNLQVFPGKGNGTFGSPSTVAIDGWPLELALADINADGKLDVAVATGDVQILIGKGNGTFAPATTLSGGPGVSGVALGDVDVDGHVDLVVTNELSGSVRILFGDGHGAFAGTDTFATGLDPIQPVITDINGDGRPDILTADVVGDDVTLLLGACRR